MSFSLNTLSMKIVSSQIFCSQSWDIMGSINDKSSIYCKTLKFWLTFYLAIFANGLKFANIKGYIRNNHKAAKVNGQQFLKIWISQI